MRPAAPRDDGEVLLLDDDDGALSIVENVLSTAGYRCLSATTAKAALRIAAEYSTIDAVVSDILMPDTSGFEFVRHLRALCVTRAPPPVLLLTGQPSLQLAAEALRLGVHDLLFKPVPPAELVDAVRRAVAKMKENRARGALPAVEASRLARQARELAAELLDIAASADVPMEDISSDPGRITESAAVLELLTRVRGLKRECAGRDLDELAWDLLIELAQAEHRSVRLSVSDLMVSSVAASCTTVLRRVNELERLGYVVKSPDPSDARRDFVAVTPKGRGLLRDFLQRAREQVRRWDQGNG